MAIARCDNCNQVRPGSHAAPHGCEGFFCYVCRGDTVNPYNEPFVLNGERLVVWRTENNVSIHTNGRALSLSIEQARVLLTGLQEVLSGDYDRAVTADMLASRKKEIKFDIDLLRDLDL
jgi:hypothetical protein